MYNVLLPLNAYEKLPYYTDGSVPVTESIHEEFIEDISIGKEVTLTE
jgi:hypothetical protein